PLAAGNYYYLVHFTSTNGNYTDGDSAAELLTIDKAQLSISTTLHNGTAGGAAITNGTHLPLGTTVVDTSSVTGQVSGFTPAGTVTHSFHNVAALTLPDALPIWPRATGSSYVLIHCASTNGNYTDGDSAAELFTIDKAQLSISTTLHNG